MLNDSFFAPGSASVDVFRILRSECAYGLLGRLWHIFMMWRCLVRHDNMHILFSNLLLCTFISYLVTNWELLLLKLVLLLPRSMLIVSVVTLFFILCQLNCTYYNCVLYTALSGYVSISRQPISLKWIQILNLSCLSRVFLMVATILTSIELAVEAFDWHAVLSLSSSSLLCRL